MTAKRDQIPPLCLLGHTIVSAIFASVMILISLVHVSYRNKEIDDVNQWLRYKYVFFVSVKGDSLESLDKKFGAVSLEQKHELHLAMTIGQFIRKEYEKGVDIEKLIFYGQIWKDFIEKQAKSPDGTSTPAIKVEFDDTPLMAMVMSTRWQGMIKNEEYIGVIKSYLKKEKIELPYPDFKESIAFVEFLSANMMFIVIPSQFLFFLGYFVYRWWNDLIPSGSSWEYEWHDLEWGRPVTYVILLPVLPVSFLFVLAASTFNILDRFKDSRLGKGNRRLYLDLEREEKFKLSLDESRASLSRLSERVNKRKEAL